MSKIITFTHRKKISHGNRVKDAGIAGDDVRVQQLKIISHQTNKFTPSNKEKKAHQAHVPDALAYFGVP